MWGPLPRSRGSVTASRTGPDGDVSRLNLCVGMGVIRTHCGVCGARRLAPRRRYRQAMLVDCASCGHTMAGRVPSQHELEAHYRLYDRDRSISPITVRRYDELLSSLDRFRKLNRLLDFGCGSGHFLVAARRQGWEVDGVELDEDAIRACADRGLEVGREIGSFESGAFDVVTAIEVVEHLDDPLESLRQFRRVLRPGGAAYVTTPNFDSLTRRLLGPRWRIVEYPEHLQYFTSRSLGQAAGRSEFEVTLMGSSGISPRDILNGLSKGR